MKAQLVGIGVAALALLAPSLAGAQTAERTYLEHGVPAPSQALELTVGTGWTQGFGNLRSGVGMPSVAHEGIGVDANVGYRISPRFAVSIGAQYQELNAQASSAARGATATIAAQFHMAPTTRLDPWLELGGGYRGLWLVPNFANEPTNLIHGVQLARARLGFDVRLSPDIAIAPVIGADATMFLYQDVGGNNTAIGNPDVSTFVFAGLQGRIDVGGTKTGTATVTSASPDYE